MEPKQGEEASSKRFQPLAISRGIAAVLSVRPRVTELVYQLYGRSLHPELFEICETRTVSRGEYTATICITTSGHLVTWRYHGQTLTEVATEKNSTTIFPVPIDLLKPFIEKKST